MKRVVHAVAVACAVFGGPVHAEAGHVVRFGTEPNYYPFEYKTPDGKLAGFDYDIGSALCAAAGVQCTWVESTFDGLIPGIKARKFDIINSDFSATEARARVIDFSDMLYDVTRRLVAKKGANLQPTVASLAGKTVGVVQGTIEEIYVRQNWGAHGVNVATYQTADQAYADLANGRIDATFQNVQAAKKGFLSKPQGAGFDYSGAPIIDERTLGVGVALGFRKEDAALRERFNLALAKIKADGTLQQLVEKYFPPGFIMLK
ncbi:MULTISPECIES: transporter substrate-binding domain-containing protein [Burkholderia]|uniref:transporter substrate-binding domain-containing protein n=1 Tax=Burkholderia TaxID=32008 RepID=UPI000BF77DCA|nr:lysine/arginine/ornithine transport system substrate-binding protein [Burkholderia sp. JKS000303]